MSAPLDDLTVVTIESWMAAPSASAILADMGATVIKVEPLTGDPMRGMSRPAKIDGPLAGYDFQFDVDNRGKKSLAVALDTDAGRAVVYKLLAKADIFMCNLLLRRQQKFGLDPDAVKAINSKIVHATLTGYGTTGPEAWRPGYDVTAFFGRSGLYDAMREGDEGQVPMARPAQGDHTTGLAFVAAILAAQRAVERFGTAQVVETSLFETAVWTQATDFGTTAVDAAPVRRRARRNLLAITANRFPCGDGQWLVLNNPEPHAWPRFCEALQQPELADDERFESPRQRYQNMPELVDLVDAIFLTQDRAFWGERLDKVGIVWGPVQSLDQVAKDEQAIALGLFPPLEHKTLGSYPTVNIPMRFADTNVAPRGVSPTIGENTNHLLADLGLSAAEIADLRKQGVVG